MQQHNISMFTNNMFQGYPHAVDCDLFNVLVFFFLSYLLTFAR